MKLNLAATQTDNHVAKRHQAVARWLPVILYCLNIAGTAATAVAVNTQELLYLIAFPLPMLALYLWRTAKG